MSSIGTLDKIKLIMESKDWSVYQLAMESNIPYSTLNNTFKRGGEPTISTLRKICSGLGITLSEFFSDEDTPNVYEYSIEEREMITVYQSLRPKEQKLLTAYAYGLARKLPDAE